MSGNEGLCRGRKGTRILSSSKVSVDVGVGQTFSFGYGNCDRCLMTHFLDPLPTAHNSRCMRMWVWLQLNKLSVSAVFFGTQLYDGLHAQHELLCTLRDHPPTKNHICPQELLYQQHSISHVNSHSPTSSVSILCLELLILSQESCCYTGHSKREREGGGGGGGGVY
jgi:hypothetical protein